MRLEAPNSVTKILLHTCCAPCSSAIVECLLQNGITPTLYYFNPNIHPQQEYTTRKDESKRYAQLLNLNFIDADYDHSQWLTAISGLEDEPERGARCLKCFTLRLTQTARFASENGFEVFATTLATSRWKNLEQVNSAGKSASQKYPTTIFWEQNWRKDGLQERRAQIIKELNFYNQTYCGCEFSKDRF